MCFSILTYLQLILWLMFGILLKQYIWYDPGINVQKILSQIQFSDAWNVERITGIYRQICTSLLIILNKLYLKKRNCHIVNRHMQHIGSRVVLWGGCIYKYVQIPERLSSSRFQQCDHVALNSSILSTDIQTSQVLFMKIQKVIRKIFSFFFSFLFALF